jgi:6-phosphogluconolactonase (cycloisomerase 2 family)/methionine-rich copper-binding protein CopC
MRSILRLAPALLLALAACSSSPSAPPPTITAQPVDAAVLEAIPATFTVTASGAASYQWRKNGTAIAGATSASYVTPAATAADDQAAFSVVVTGDGGSVTSAAATLRVVLPATITASPSDLAVLEGGSVSLAVAATGNGTLTYQWQLYGADVAGATSATLTIPAASVADAGAYTCDVTNAIGAVKVPRTSVAAFLTVLDTPVITLQPAGGTLVPGDAWVLRTHATTMNYGHTYQWRKDGVDLAGATGETYAIGSAVAGDGGAYTCVVSNSALGVTASATTSPATLTIRLSPMILAQPGARAVVTGQAATFRVSAKGGGTLSYQWFKGTTPVGTGAPTYTTPPATSGDDGATYHVVVSNGTLPDAVSANAVLSVATATAGLASSATTISLGEGVILSWVVPTGSTATLALGAAAATAVSTGSQVVYPAATTTYRLAVTTGGVTVDHDVIVTVKSYTPTHLFVVNSGSNDVSSFAIDLAGSPIIGSPDATTPAGNGPIHVVASPDEQHLYVSNSADGTVSGFSVDAATGSLTPIPGSPFPLSSAAASPWAAAVSPTGAKLYVACAEGIEVFTVDPVTGALSARATAAAIPGRVRGDLLLHPSGLALYVADAGHALVKGYAVAADGSLTFSGEVPVGMGATALALDRAGSVLFTRGESMESNFNARIDSIALEGDRTLGATSTWAGFGPQAVVGTDMPWVRGADGHHALATSRRPGVDQLFNSYDGEFTAYSTFSAYVFDPATAAITAEWVDGVLGFNSPMSVQSFDLVPNGDSVVVDRSGSLIVLPVAANWDRVYAWTQGPDKAINPVGNMMGQTFRRTGVSPAHACFTGTLQ